MNQSLLQSQLLACGKGRSIVSILPFLSFLALLLGFPQAAKADQPELDFSDADTPINSSEPPTSRSETAEAQVPTLAAHSRTFAVQPISLPATSAPLDRAPIEELPSEALNFADPATITASASALTQRTTKAPKPERSRQPSSSVTQPTRQPTSTPPVTAHWSLKEFNREAQLFEGGSSSLVAKAVGSAEGTRTPDGKKTLAYYGHVDPGNGVWNLGSFSYQHGARSPEEADDKQLRRLRSQASVLRQKATDQGIRLTLEEELNGIDLANQAPLAALDRGGYIDWLAEAHKLGLKGSDAVLWARTRSFLDPDTGRWNAPGLGNNVYWISHDQERRLMAIARAIATHVQQQPPSQPFKSAPASPEAIADQIIQTDLAQ